MSSFEFTLILTGFAELTESIEDKLYGVGCDDALLGIRSGVPFLDFEREAGSFLEAVLSAIENVHKSGVAKVVRVEPEDLVTASEIAERSDRTRESVRLLVAGQRGPGGFPVAVNPSAKTRLWRWSEVLRWMQEHQFLPSRETTTDRSSNILAAVNGALDIRRNTSPEEARDIVTNILPITVAEIVNPTVIRMERTVQSTYRPQISAFELEAHLTQTAALRRSSTTDFRVGF